MTGFVMNSTPTVTRCEWWVNTTKQVLDASVDRCPYPIREVELDGLCVVCDYGEAVILHGAGPFMEPDHPYQPGTEWQHWTNIKTLYGQTITRVITDEEAGHPPEPPA
jgi:hypothetical protein